MPKTEPAADVVVSTTTALYAQLATWESEGPTSEKVVEYTGTQSGNLDFDQFNGYQFSNMVTIRGPVPTSPGRYSGTGWASIRLDACENITIAYMKTARTGTSGNTVFIDESASNIVVRDCDLNGPDVGDSDDLTSNAYTIFIDSASDIQILDNVIGWGSKCIRCQTGTNVTISGNVFYEPYGDDISHSSNTNLLIEDNWFSRSNRGAPGSGGAHTDWDQFDVGSVTNKIARYNIGLIGSDGGVNKSRQAFFQQGQFNGAEYAYNIIITNTIQGIECDDKSTTGFVGGNIHHNTLLRVENQLTGNSGPIITDETGGGATYDYNVFTPASGSGSGGNAGANGRRIAIGSAPFVAGDFTEYDTYFSNPIVKDMDFIDTAPIEGSGMHWNDADPEGAADCWKRVLVDGIHPGRYNNAASALWRSEFDPSSRIGGSSAPQAFPPNGVVTFSVAVS